MNEPKAERNSDDNPRGRRDEDGLSNMRRLTRHQKLPAESTSTSHGAATEKRSKESKPSQPTPKPPSSSEKELKIAVQDSYNAIGLNINLQFTYDRNAILTPNSISMHTNKQRAVLTLESFNDIQAAVVKVIKCFPSSSNDRALKREGGLVKLLCHHDEPWEELDSLEDVAKAL